MLPVSSKELEVHLSLQLRNGSPADNLKATALELLSRASTLDEAVRMLKLPYTYTITTRDPNKVNARKTLGGMSSEVLESMRDELIRAGIQRWQEYEACGKEDGN